jgi:hypothetical protein
MCLGDLISQKFIEKKQLESINLWRTARFGLVGFCIVVRVIFDLLQYFM